MTNQFNVNMGKLVSFLFRRDRIRIPVWILSIALFSLVLAPAYEEMFPTQMERQVLAETMKNPAMTAMVGPGYGLDNYTIGAMYGHEMLLFTAIAVAIMSMFIVIRHTRKDEEGGRIEMIRSLPVGRLSNLGAAITASVCANIVLSLLTGFGLYAMGVDSMDLQGCLLYGAALGVTGLLFTSVAAVFSQLFESSRGATGYSFAFLLVAYFIRAVGDVSNEALALASPLGWILRTEVFVNNVWWPIFLTVAVSVVLSLIAMYLNSLRDLEAGFIPAKIGRKNASTFLNGPLSLALRLQRTGMIAWIVGLFVIGVSYGSIFGDLEEFIKTNEFIGKMIPVAEGFSLTELFMTTLMAIMSMISTVPVLMFVLKFRGEEKRYRIEHLLARSVSRSRILGGYVSIAFVASFVMIFLSVVGLWASSSAVMEDPIPFGRMLQAGMVYLPAIWIMIGMAVFLTAYLPKAVSFVWLYLGYTFFVVYLGDIIGVPAWMKKLTSFGHIPKLPVEEMDFVKVAVLTFISIALTVIGFIGYRNRDMQG